MRAHRPVFLLGHGVRLAGAADLIPALLDLGVPVLTSWPAADLVDSDHPSAFGRPGVYGQRCANRVFANSDLILAIGCRLSVWTVGYDFPQPDQRVVMVNVDGAEARSFGNVEFIEQDAKAFIQELLARRSGNPWWEDEDLPGWRLACETTRRLYPVLESPLHDDTDGYLNPHRFVSRLQAFLSPDEVIVTDCATGNLCAHQILSLKPPQRLMTSGGLGEMGCGLPAAIGASFARGKGRVICLHTDGAMMFNLSELATIAHHRLPIKIIVFRNDGYGMIRDTQRNLGYAYTGVDAASGVSTPWFWRVAEAFDIEVVSTLEALFHGDGPALLEVLIDPAYVFGPKLRPIRHADGTISNAKFHEMSPAVA